MKTAYISFAFFVWLIFSVLDATGQALPLDPSSVTGFNTHISKAYYKGKKAIHLTGTGASINSEQIAVLKDLVFTNGTIEIEISGQPLSGTDTAFRGFIGIAFRLQDTSLYECFYIRPTNGRANDQLRRNHSTQYISHPEYPWYRLRNEMPGIYESYADMEPGEWIKMKITVQGNNASLYINNTAHPCLVVKDLKQCIQPGAVGLWIGPGTDGYFSNLVIKPFLN